MDVFKLKWSIQKLVPSKEFLKAGEPVEMWTEKHIKWHFVKEKGANQTIEDLLLEIEELRKSTGEDMRLRIEFMINGRSFDQVWKYQVYKGTFDLFFKGYFSSFEFIEAKKAYKWGLFMINRFLGETFSLEDITWINDLHFKKLQFKEEQESGVQIFCCGQCGDRNCGSWDAHITKKGNTIVWDWGQYIEKPLPFYFEFQQYQQEFEEYRQYLLRRIEDIDSGSDKDNRKCSILN
jgi:hypothetical protein